MIRYRLNLDLEFPFQRRHFAHRTKIAQQLLTIIQWLFSFKRIVTDLKFSTNQMLYQPSWIKDKVIRQRFWRDPFKEYHSRPQIRGQGLTKFHLWAFGFGEQKKRNTTWFRIFVSCLTFISSGIIPHYSCVKLSFFLFLGIILKILISSPCNCTILEF
jgi:hypothetical protein